MPHAGLFVVANYVVFRMALGAHIASWSFSRCSRRRLK